MPMTRFFSHEMESAHVTFKNGNYRPSYESTIKQLAKFSAPAGPHVAYASALPKLRGYLLTDGNFGLFSKGRAVPLAQGTLAATGDYDVDKHADYTRCNANTCAKLAALVLFRHTTVERERGGQKVMICSLPKSYSDWPSQLFKGKHVGQIMGYLADSTEHLRQQDKTNLANAVQHAQAWCQRALIVLANANGGVGKPLLQRAASMLTESNATRAKAKASARDLVKRWFADVNTTEQQLDRAIGKLQTGFKRMVTLLNSNQLILTDHVQLRNSVKDTPDWDNQKSESFVRGVPERLAVIYIADNFLTNKGIIKDHRDWARILIHETAHREAGLGKDVRYAAVKSIKPTSATFSHAQAMVNADSWAFFCADAAGQLTDAERKVAFDH